MHGHGRPWQTNLRFTGHRTFFDRNRRFFAVPCLTARADNAIATESLPIAWQDDAELTDVCFVNRNVGWAVGAQGVILRTIDGGKTWLQPSDVAIASVEQQFNESMGKLQLSEKLGRMQQGPQSQLTHRNLVADASRREIRVRFESVHFIDPKHGWAAGGYNVPWMDDSRGVIIRTSDGGQTWQAVKRLAIPRVNKIRFSSRRTGWAMGETNALYPDGLYFTNDGGVNWSSQSATRMNSWIDGQQVGGQFVSLDQTGRLASIVGGNLNRPALFGCSREDRINCLAMQDDRLGFAAGQGGLVLKTTDGGSSWKRWSVDTGSDRSVRSIAVTDQDVFLTLATGGMLRVGLQDEVVESINLPTSLPVRAIQFVDAQIGFAVGDLGTILSTVDGGETWRKQRGEHDRLAMLFIATRAEDLSLSLMTYNAGEESRLCGTLLLEDQPTPHMVSTQAFERVGSAVNWRRTASGEQQTSDALVDAIRALKPLVVVCCHDLGSSDRYREAITLQQWVSQSIDQAADAAHSRDAESPWQVQRLVTSDLAGSVRLDSSRMMPSMGRTVSDQIAVSRALLGRSIRATKISNWRVTHPAQKRTLRGNDLLSGLARKGTPIPIRQRRTALGNLSLMNQALARHQQAERLVDMPVQTDQDLAMWRQTMLSVTATTDEQLAGLWLADLAERYLEAARFDMADHSLEALTTYWSDHAFAPAANAWLAIKRSQDASLDGELTLSSETQRRILEPFMRLTQGDPSLALEPAWQWLELNLLARTTGLRSVEPKLVQMAQRTSGNPLEQSFTSVAQQELLLLRASGHPSGMSDSNAQTKRLASTFATERPKLDGVLDDAVWRDAHTQRNATEFEITSADIGQHSDEIMFAHDDQFFYGAIRCQKLPTQSYRDRQGVRTRDPDLSRNDRVELTLDPILNFSGGIKLVIDHRGWVAESKLASKKWNPDWYVAAADDEKTWTVEFAIPLAAIYHPSATTPVEASKSPSRGWAVRIARLNDRSRCVWEGVPAPKEKVGLQASLKPDPTGFRRLIFSPNPELSIPMQDPHVQPARYQLESSEESDRFHQPPQVPDIHGAGSR